MLRRIVLAVRSACVLIALLLATAGVQSALAQDDLGPTTPGAIPDPSTYQGSQQIQRQMDQQDQQIRQQQQSPQQYQPGYQGNGAPREQAWGYADAASFAKLPPLVASSNPLLGRWRPTQRIAKHTATGNAAIDNLASRLGAVVAAGDCNETFGQGLVEFDATSMSLVGPGGARGGIRRVTYRGAGSRVSVVPEGSSAYGQLNFQFDAKDHAILPGQGCGLERVGGASPPQSRDPPRSSGPAPLAASPLAASTASATSAVPVQSEAARNAILVVNAGVVVPSIGMVLVKGTNLYISKHTANAALVRAGYSAPATSGGPLRAWASACSADNGACQRGLIAMTADPIAATTTDANGHARMTPVPIGRYFVFAFATIGGQSYLWDVQADMGSGGNFVTLDQRNAMAFPAIAAHTGLPAVQ